MGEAGQLNDPTRVEMKTRMCHHDEHGKGGK